MMHAVRETDSIKRSERSRPSIFFPFPPGVDRGEFDVPQRRSAIKHFERLEDESDTLIPHQRKFG